jgi:outer membrane protein assembly factor BamA
MKYLCPLLCCSVLLGLSGQVQQPADTANAPASRDFRRIDILPAISYAPETKLTLGVIGVYYMDLYRGDTSTRFSNVQFLAVYTLANQVSTRLNWDIFTDGNRWRFRGETFFDIYPDRNYGRGNGASSLVVEFDEDGGADTLNYLNFNSNRLNFAPAFMRKLGRHWYVGLHYNLEYLFNARPIPDRWAFANADSTRISNLPDEGLRSGLGTIALFDSRDYVLNPIRGSLVEFSSLHFGTWLGSDFTFHSLRLDARQYINTWKNQTLALRGVVNFRFTPDANGIPLRALSRVGGRNFIRGYFLGTYQDNHLLAAEAEYRLPFWRESDTDPFWKIWKRLGLAVFGGVAQVAPRPGDFRMDQFRTAVGAGLRVLFNRKSRVTIRIDYALGLSAGSNGPGRRQSGFYFYLAEAF